MLNFPLALGAIALAAIAGGPRLLVWASIALCALIAVPGVVDQGDLDARWINALPALGVALALGLTVAAARGRGVASCATHAETDSGSCSASLLLLLALPWIAAEIGFHFPGDVFLGEEIPPVRDEGLAAVHLGFHHGMGGVVLALTALLLSRVAAGRALRGVPLAACSPTASRMRCRTAGTSSSGSAARVDQHLDERPAARALARLARDPRRRRRDLLRSGSGPRVQR